jgi:putative oxidoreductase
MVRPTRTLSPLEDRMTVVRRLARPMLAAMFIDGGLDALRHPSTKVGKAGPVVSKLAGPLHLPDDPELLVRANGAAMVGAGGLLAFGKFPRLAALVLAASLVPTTAAGHRFWEESDPVTKRNQRVHFLKNVGLLGGTLLAVVDTGGKPGVPWRARRAAKDAARTARTARREAKMAARTAKAQTRLAAHQAVEALPSFD